MKSYRLSTSPVRCSHCTLGYPKKSFSSVLFIHRPFFWLFTLSHKKTICRPNPLAHSTWKCHYSNLRIAKLFQPTESSLRSFKRWTLLKEPVLWTVNRGLWKEPVVMCSNWNVRQAMSQQMFRVTTFCVNKCFRSFSTLFSRIVHHAVLKFSTSQQAAVASLNMSISIHALLL